MTGVSVSKLKYIAKENKCILERVGVAILSKSLS